MNDTYNFEMAVNAELEAWQAANYPSVGVFYFNGPQPDESEVGPFWVDSEIRWYSAANVTIEKDPVGRHQGVIALHVFARVGEGSEQISKILDSLIARFRDRRLGTAILRMPQRTVASNTKGWVKSGIFVPFHLDS